MIKCNLLIASFTRHMKKSSLCEVFCKGAGCKIIRKFSWFFKEKFKWIFFHKLTRIYLRSTNPHLNFSPLFINTSEFVATLSIPLPFTFDLKEHFCFHSPGRIHFFFMFCQILRYLYFQVKWRNFNGEKLWWNNFGWSGRTIFKNFGVTVTYNHFHILRLFDVFTTSETT